jgi:hypothetical protein
LSASHGDGVRALLGGLSLLELVPPVLARALEPYPAPVPTLDALHLASIVFLRELGQRPALATYDLRLAAAATALGMPIVPI